MDRQGLSKPWLADWENPLADDQRDPQADDEPAKQADNGYTISVSPSVKTPERTVTLDGKDFTLNRLGKVEPGGELTVSVTVPNTEAYTIQLRDPEEFVRRLRSNLSGDTTVVFDTGPTSDKDALTPRSYGAAAVRSGDLKAFFPVVVSGYDVDVQAPDRTLTQFEVTATISELPSEQPTPSVDSLEAVVWTPGTNNEERFELTAVGANTYRTAIQKPAGNYNLAVAVLTTEPTGDTEAVGYSDTKQLTVVENGESLSKERSISTADRLQYSRPAVTTDTICVGGLGPAISAFENTSNHPQQWIRQREGSLSDSSPLLVDETVYVGSGGGVFYALDAADGSVIWSVDVESAVTSTPTLLDGTVYFGSNDGRIHAVDTGQQGSLTTKWSTAVGSPVYSTLASGGGRLYVTTNGGDVVALNPDGTEAWRRTDDVAFGASSPTYVNGSLYVAGSTVDSIDPSTGDLQWAEAYYHDGAGSTPVVRNDTVYVGDTAGTVYALDGSSGAIEWTFKFTDAIGASPAVVNDRLVVADTSGTVGVLERATGSWIGGCTLADTVRSPVVVSAGNAFVGTQSGDIVVFQNINNLWKM